MHQYKNLNTNLQKYTISTTQSMIVILCLLLIVLSNRTASITQQREALFASALQSVLCVVFSITVVPDQACHQQLPKTTYNFFLVKHTHTPHKLQLKIIFYKNT